MAYLLQQCRIGNICAPNTYKRRRTKQVIPVAAALLFVACTKISMNGNPVGVSKAALISPRQNKRAIRSARPNTPLSIIVEIIAQGTIVEALWISSAIWQALSAPGIDVSSNAVWLHRELTQEREDTRYEANEK